MFAILSLIGVKECSHRGTECAFWWALWSRWWFDLTHPAFLMTHTSSLMDDAHFLKIFDRHRLRMAFMWWWEMVANKWRWRGLCWYGATWEHHALLPPDCSSRAAAPKIQIRSIIVWKTEKILPPSFHLPHVQTCSFPWYTVVPGLLSRHKRRFSCTWAIIVVIARMLASEKSSLSSFLCLSSRTLLSSCHSEDAAHW